MFNRDAERVTEQILRNASVGTEIFFNDDQGATPHYNNLKSDKGLHVKVWKAVKRSHGDIKAVKKWASYCIMNLSLENTQYDKQWDIVDTFYNTNEPEGFGDVVTSDEANALAAYYFVNYKEQDVYEHRARMTKEHPELVRVAIAAARKIAARDEVPEEEIEGAFLKEY